jgi:hypothetical protein
MPDPPPPLGGTCHQPHRHAVPPLPRRQPQSADADEDRSTRCSRTRNSASRSTLSRHSVRRTAYRTTSRGSARPTAPRGDTDQRPRPRAAVVRPETVGFLLSRPPEREPALRSGGDQLDRVLSHWHRDAQRHRDPRRQQPAAARHDETSTDDVPGSHLIPTGRGPVSASGRCPRTPARA